jgi:pilus assembly protein CpaF
MFSRFKKPDDASARPTATAAVSSAGPAAARPAPSTAAQVALAARPLPSAPAPRPPAEAVAADKEKKRKERLQELKVELHKRLLENLNLAALEHASENSLKQEIGAIANEALDEMSVVLPKDDRAILQQELYDEVMGLGPLEPLLKDKTVNDILVNGPNRIFVERGGKLELTDITFKDERHLLRIIDKIVSAVGRRVDESNPYCDARLQDGSRFNVMVPPVATMPKRGLVMILGTFITLEIPVSGSVTVSSTMMVFVVGSATKGVTDEAGWPWTGSAVKPSADSKP